MFKIVILYVFGFIIQTIRPIYGPMPQVVCRVSVAIQVFTGMNIVLLSLSVTVVRFAFIWIYRAIPTMDDEFLVKFIVRAITLWTAISSAFKYYIEDKINISEV